MQHEILKRLYTVLYYRFLEGWAGWKEMMVTRGKTAIGDKKKSHLVSMRRLTSKGSLPIGGVDKHRCV